MAIKNPETDATEDETEKQNQKCDFEKFEGIVSVFELQILCFYYEPIHSKLRKLRTKLFA